jgi:transcriptional regulator with XRE-family HTH domain
VSILTSTKIREKRKSKGITVTFMAKKLGYKYPSGYSNIESGRVKPSLAKAKAISEILDCDMESLFFNEKLPETSNYKEQEVS